MPTIPTVPLPKTETVGAARTALGAKYGTDANSPAATYSDKEAAHWADSTKVIGGHAVHIRGTMHGGGEVPEDCAYNLQKGEHVLSRAVVDGLSHRPKMPRGMKDMRKHGIHETYIKHNHDGSHHITHHHMNPDVQTTTHGAEHLEALHDHLEEVLGGKPSKEEMENE